MPVTGSFRGGLQVAETLYGAWTGELYTVNLSGESVLYSTTALPSTDRIFIAQNNKSPAAQVAIVANSGTAYLTTSGTAVLSTYPDADIGTPSCVTAHLGFFFFGYGNGNIQASDLNDYNLNTLNVGRTESNPDGVSNMFPYNGQLYVFGEKTLEVWGDPINEEGFPLTRIGFNILPGLKTAHAVAGWQPEFGHPPIWVGNDNTVRQLNGFTAERISNPDLEKLIAAIAFPETQLEVVCYVTGGQAFWQVTSVDTEDDNNSWSWVYNLNSKSWHERKSYQLNYSQFRRSVPAFNKWLVGSYNSSDLMEMDYSATEEAGDPVTCVLESGPIKDFPNRQRIARADFDFSVGVGEVSTNEQLARPTALIECSKNGGQSWDLSWVRSLGEVGDYDRRVYVLNAGLSGDEGARWRWTISDPVHVAFIGGAMDTEVVKK